MKKILLATSLLFSFVLQAQNWELFKANETYNFNFDNIHGVRVDSVKTQGNDTVFYFNRTLNDSVFHNFLFYRYPVKSICKPNIFGSLVTKRNDSLIFTNKLNKTLYLKPSAPLNYSWNILSSDSTKIEAYIDSIYVDTINQVPDSIKIISFQYKDSSNNLISHSINSQKIIISKSNGFVSTFSLYDNSLEQPVTSSLRRFNQLFKTTTFTNAQVFDLNVGDEYHFMLNDRPPNTPPGHDIYNHTVMSKSTSTNGDTIRLQILERREKRTSVVDYTTSPPSIVHTTTHSSRSLTRTILQPNAIFNSDVGYEVTKWADTTSGIIDSIATITGYSHYLPYYNTYTYNNRITINPEGEFFAYDSTLKSWLVDPSLKNQYTHHYLVGVIYFMNYWNNQSGGGGYPEYYSMLYFKKGNETWGTPRLVTGIEGPIKTEEEIYLYPNPSNDIIQLETAGIPFKQIQLFNIQGRMIRELKFQKQVNISELENGLYFIKLVSEEQVVELKFMKQ